MNFTQAVHAERPALTDEVARRNIGRAVRLTARRSTPARSANDKLESLPLPRRSSRQIPH